jgi:serine phosphatase RsbU (regulator of sigma subunit)
LDFTDTKTLEIRGGAPQGAVDGAHYLVVVEGEHPGLRREIASSITIGRDTSCLMRFRDPGLSKFHCRVRSEQQGITVSDLGSTNGTFVNGRRIEGAVELAVEALLQVGSQVLRHELRSRAEIARLQELADDLEKARAYVAALIPAPLTTGAVRTDWCFQPSAVLGGDLFGYHPLDAARFALYLLDVCGHGVGAAMHSASVFNVIRNRTLPETDFGRPEEVLARLNESFQMERHGGMYFSIWYGVYDSAARTLEYSSGGHPPALLRDRESGGLRRLQTRNPPIGVLAGCRFTRERATTQGGERLYLFSDGVFEIVARDGQQWAFEDFERLAREPGRPGQAESERLRSAMRNAARNEIFEDDFSLLVVSFD